MSLDVTHLLLFLILCALVPGLFALVIGVLYVGFIGLVLLALGGGLFFWVVHDPASAGPAVIGGVFFLVIFIAIAAFVTGRNRRIGVAEKERQDRKNFVAKDARNRIEIIDQIRKSCSPWSSYKTTVDELLEQGRIECREFNGVRIFWKVIESPENAGLEWADRQMGWPHRYPSAKALEPQAADIWMDSFNAWMDRHLSLRPKRSF